MRTSPSSILLLLAYDIVHYFRRLCLPRSYRYKTLKTLRMELIEVPGRLVNAQRRYRLALPRHFHFADLFQLALTKVERLRV